MSENARRARRIENHRCDACGEVARYYSRARRRWVWAADHALCQRCWTSEHDAARARQLGARVQHGAWAG